MGKRSINGSDFAAMALMGADMLKRNVEKVNALNVFPVPDGDTGTNMNLTMSSGVAELKRKPSQHVGKAAEALSKGLLMGARGNSGVILSQLFRGFAKYLAGHENATALDFAAALQHGVDLAYKAVVKPVEGTILTVAKEAARHAVQVAGRNTEVTDLMNQVYVRANEALQKTPDLLPVLKQVGVVDSGGQGLVYIYEGFVQYLSGVTTEESDVIASEAAPAEVYVPVHAEPTSAQAKLETLDIEFFYDMEFFIKRNVSDAAVAFFDESAYKKALSKDGDSILVITDDDIIKVHVHSRKPGDVLNLSMPYGELTDIHILNMREQHRELLAEEVAEASSSVNLAAAELLAGQAIDNRPAEHGVERAPYGMIAVSMGEGIAELFRSSDVDIVLSGGQTMNPSTEDFVKAIDSLSAEHIFIFPNNSNIVLAAEQAVELTDRAVTVIPTKTIPQGIAAVLAFKEDETPERNKEWMTAAASMVVSGQVTKAVRDTNIDNITISEGHYIGIKDKTIVTSQPDLIAACTELLQRMLEEEADIITILTGEDATEEVTTAICNWLSENYGDYDIDLQYGGQPLYPYLFAVE